MRVAIISDVHNNTTNLKKVLDFCAKEKIEKIICCGDLSSNETLDFLNDNFSAASEGSTFGAPKVEPSPSIYYALGNAEDGQLNGMENIVEYKKTKLFQKFGVAELAGKMVAFVHFPIEAKKLAESGKYEFVFYGHTHKPWTEKINNCEMLNPGNVTGTFYLPTFAVWNTDDGKFELIRIHELKF